MINGTLYASADVEILSLFSWITKQRRTALQVRLVLQWMTKKQAEKDSCTIVNKIESLETDWNNNKVYLYVSERLCKNVVVHHHVFIVFC